METTLVICLFFATHLHASSADSISTASISTSTTSAVDSNATVTASSSSFDEAEELAKIAASCLTSSDYGELTGNIVGPLLTRMLASFLVSETIASIGLAELRATLNFAPLRPWTHYNYTDPSEAESAPSIEAYYDLKEPHSRARSLDSLFLLEKNMIPAIAYFDKRFPSIRTIFRRRFEAIRWSDQEVVDRKTVDRMIEEFLESWNRVIRATDEVLSPLRNRECMDD